MVPLTGAEGLAQALSLSHSIKPTLHYTTSDLLNFISIQHLASGNHHYVDPSAKCKVFAVPSLENKMNPLCRVSALHLTGEVCLQIVVKNTTRFVIQRLRCNEICRQ